MPIVHHRNPSLVSFPIWIGARAVLKPTLALWPLSKVGMKPLHLIDKLAGLAPKPESVVMESMSLAGRPVDLFLPKGPTRRDSDTAVLYLHGGAFVVAGRGTHRSITTRLCLATELPVFSLDYRQLPVGGVGTSTHDAFSAYRELIEQRGYRNVVVAGDSAGGFLCGKILELAAENELPKPVAFLGISPLLDLDLGTNPDRSSDADAYLPQGKMAVLAPMFDWGPIPLAGTRRINTLDSKLFPPTILITASDEMIEPDAIELIEKLDADGVRAVAHSYSWQVHAFPVLVPHAHPEITHAVDALATFATEAIMAARGTGKESDKLIG